MGKKALFLDFDGVLFNTIKEVYLVNRLQHLGIDFFEEINKKNYDLYTKYKYLVYNIWMFYYYNPLIFDNNNEKIIVDEYKKAISNRDLEAEKKFCEDFLNIRRKLVKNHFDFWKNLETPYEFFFEIKKLIEKNILNIIIVSKKNKTSILERFETYRLNFDPNKVFAREALAPYSTKGDFLKEYMQKNNIDSAIFIDDNNNNVMTVSDNPKIKGLLALWGNARPNSKGYSEKEAFEIIKNYINE